jgi:hypothetical protein
MEFVMKRCLTVLPLFLSALVAQTPAPAAAQKGPDKEIATKIALLKECVLDKKCARDQEGLGIIDALQQKQQAGGVDPKDQQAIVKALEHALSSGKLRPHDQTQIYVGAAAALGYCGPDGAKVLKEAFLSKRFPEKPDWVRLREHFLKNLGRTKDESMIKFLCNEARRNPSFPLSGVAGEALGNFDESKEAVRKEIVSELMIKYGELAELASQLGTNVQAQNAQDQLAAVSDKWNSTLAKMTKQSFATFREWQTWHNKHKNQPW